MWPDLRPVAAMLLLSLAPAIPVVASLLIERRPNAPMIAKPGAPAEPAMSTVLQSLGTALQQFPRTVVDGPSWPESLQCRSCNALRNAAATVTQTASEWPQSTRNPSDPLQPPPDLLPQRLAMAETVCAARPPRDARDEISMRFKYYTWTAEGSRWMDVAAWFERPDVITACKHHERR